MYGRLTIIGVQTQFRERLLGKGSILDRFWQAEPCHTLDSDGGWISTITMSITIITMFFCATIV